MASVLNKEPKYKVQKFKYRKLEVAQPRINNKPSWISPQEILQSRLINTVYHLLAKNNKGKGRGAWEGGLINFLPQKRRRLLERRRLFEKGWLNRGFTVISRFYETVYSQGFFFYDFNTEILAWDHALSLLSLFVSHGKTFFPFASPALKKEKKNVW